MKEKTLLALHLTLCVLLCSFTAFSQTPQKKTGQKIPANMFPVKPVASNAAQSAPSLTIGNGKFFSYALPAGWHVGEDGQFALTLAAQDNKALTVMVGNAGLPVNYPPARFVFEKLSALQPQNLQIGPPQRAAPIAGFTQAYQFDVTYSAGGVPCRGVVKCHIYPAYDSAVMAMTAALSVSSQWQGYASWLPLVAEQISAMNGAAFGRRGIMAQNLKNSTEYGEAARKYREWSQKNWQQVTDDRNASQDRTNFHRRENLGGVQTYTNPFASTPPVELPTTYKYYWTDNQGNYLGSDDPSANPNAGSTSEWRQMPRYKP